MELLSLASRHRAWLATRQIAVAENIANADTPGFTARSVASFSEVLGAQSGGMRASHPRHLVPDTTPRTQVSETEDAEARVGTHSGNSVSVEEQLLEASAVSREFSLNASISKTFRRMLMSISRV